MQLIDSRAIRDIWKSFFCMVLHTGTNCEMQQSSREVRLPHLPGRCIAMQWRVDAGCTPVLLPCLLFYPVRFIIPDQLSVGRGGRLRKIACIRGLLARRRTDAGSTAVLFSCLFFFLSFFLSFFLFLSFFSGAAQCSLPPTRVDREESWRSPKLLIDSFYIVIIQLYPFYLVS